MLAHEALVRWQHPARGLVPPADFLQLAEDTGLIIGLGEWVLREACRWATFIGTERGVQVSVNLSLRQFNDPKLIELVRRVLAESGLPPQLLMLEMTETTAMHQTDVAASTLRQAEGAGRVRSRSTTSAPATPTSPRCGASRWTCSRSTARSSPTCRPTDTRRRSPAASSAWRTRSA